MLNINVQGSIKFQLDSLMIDDCKKVIWDEIKNNCWLGL